MSRQFKPSQLKPGLLYDITSSWAVTASYAKFSDSYHIISGSTEALVTPENDIFLIKNNGNTVLTVSESGVVVFATQSSELNDPALYGGIYFTSGSFFVGLE
jgi:hypothetical protein